jgi:hypothetical protein
VSAISIGGQGRSYSQASIDKERLALGPGLRRNRGGSMVRACEADQEGRRERDTQQAQHSAGATDNRREVSRWACIGRSECPMSARHDRSRAPHVAWPCISPVLASRFRDRQITPHSQTRFRDTSRPRLRCSSSRCSFIPSY